MGLALLLGPSDPTEAFRKALQREFATSWSIRAALVVVAFFAAVMLLTWYFSRREARAAEHGQRGDPQRLFTDLLQKLPLSADQREWLKALARDLRIAHPTVLLLSPRLLQRHAEAWIAQAGGREAGLDPRQAALWEQTRRALFPHAGTP